MKSTEIATKRAIRELSREELLAHLDQSDRGNLVLSPDFILQELSRRDSQTQNEELARMTRQIRTMTGIMAALTLIVTVATLVLVFRPGG